MTDQLVSIRPMCEYCGNTLPLVGTSGQLPLGPAPALRRTCGFTVQVWVNSSRQRTAEVFRQSYPSAR